MDAATIENYLKKYKNLELAKLNLSLTTGHLKKRLEEENLTLDTLNESVVIYGNELKSAGVTTDSYAKHQKSLQDQLFKVLTEKHNIVAALGMEGEEIAKVVAHNDLATQAYLKHGMTLEELEKKHKDLYDSMLLIKEVEDDLAIDNRAQKERRYLEKFKKVFSPEEFIKEYK